MKIKAYKCPKCGEAVYSRARHDFRWCSCRTIGVDGGFNYSKVSVSPNTSPNDVEVVEVEVSATKKELYDDWNFARDKYGIVPTGTNNVR